MIEFDQGAMDLDATPNRPSESEYVPDPKTETGWVIQGFLQAIEQHLDGAVWARHLVGSIKSQAAAMEVAYQRWVLDEPARYHLKAGAIVLAAYLALQPTMPRHEVLALLREALVGPLRDSIRQSTAGWLDHAPDPYAALVGVARSRERHFFGQSFTFERPRDDDRAYFVDITRCLWHSFFVAESTPELTSLFCAFDTNWIDAIDPDRHGVRFSRPTTLGHGGRMCPFHFYRVATMSSTASRTSGLRDEG
jgi:hypothetical protein